MLVFLKDQDFSLSLALKIPDGAKHVSGGWDLRSELIAASLERCIYPRAGCSIKDQTMEVSPEDRQEAQFQWSVFRERRAGGFGSIRWDDQRTATHLGTEMRSKSSQGQDGSGDPLMRKMVPGVSCNAKSSTPHAFAGAMAEVSKYDRIATLDALEFSWQGATEVVASVGSNQGQSVAFVGEGPLTYGAIDEKTATALAFGKIVPYIAENDGCARGCRGAKPTKMIQRSA